jgi:hypothetical protein
VAAHLCIIEQICQRGNPSRSAILTKQHGEALPAIAEADIRTNRPYCLEKVLTTPELSLPKQNLPERLAQRPCQWFMAIPRDLLTLLFEDERVGETRAPILDRVRCRGLCGASL